MITWQTISVSYQASLCPPEPCGFGDSLCTLLVKGHLPFQEWPWLWLKASLPKCFVWPIFFLSFFHFFTCCGHLKIRRFHIKLGHSTSLGATDGLSFPPLHSHMPSVGTPWVAAVAAALVLGQGLQSPAAELKSSAWGYSLTAGCCPRPFPRRAAGSSR